MKTELNKLIVDCTSELNDIDSKISSLESLDKTKAYLTQYALIKACGTLEIVYRSIVADFFDKSNLKQVPKYIEKTVRKGSMSAKYENMCNLLGKFDDDWVKDFKDLVEKHPYSQKIISSSNSLVNNRHQLAHGRNPTATFQDIFGYYNDTLELIKIMDSVVK